MKNKITFTVLVMFVSFFLKGQWYSIPKKSIVAKLQGVYCLEEPFDDRYYEIEINHQSKRLWLTKFKSTGEISKIVGFFGFQDMYKTNTVFYETALGGVFTLDSLKAEGKYYTVFMDIDNKLGVSKSPSITAIDYHQDGYMVGSFLEDYYYLQSKLPHSMEYISLELLQDLTIISQKDHRDYIAEFLELDVRRVKGDREPLYSDPYTVVDRLSKGTIVRVLGSEQKSGHVQIEYYNTENKIDTGFVIGSFLSTAIQDESGFDKPVASFDCQKSKSVVEQLICSDHHLGLLDIWLNDAYKQAKFFRPKELKSSQRAWIKERNSSIAKEQLPHQQRAILEKLYRERIAFLKEWE